MMRAPRRREVELVEEDLSAEQGKDVALLSVPSVERDDITGKYYLLDDNGDRVKPVCAAAKAGKPFGDVCIRDAGAGTSHKGEGRCNRHGGSGEIKSSIYLQLVDANGLGDQGKSFKQSMETVERFGEEVFKHDSEVKILTAALGKLLEDAMTSGDIKVELNDSNQFEVSNGISSRSFVEKLSKLTASLTTAKKARDQQNSKLTIDLPQLKSFVDQMFSIIESIVTEPQAKKIQHRIMTEVLGAVEEIN